MTQPLKLAEFFSKNEHLSLEEFLAAYPHPFLLYEGDIAENPQARGTAANESDAVKATAMIANTRRLSAVLSDADPPFTPVNVTVCWIFMIKKREANQPLPVFLGRDQQCDVPLPFEEVSSRHAGISWSPEGGNYSLIDHGSTNGTFLNTFPLSPEASQTLSDQDVIKLGVYSFLFYSPKSLHMYMTSPLR